jgi:prepilin-type N-terminal cleavage/methylation domain-containing protein
MKKAFTLIELMIVVAIIAIIAAIAIPNLLESRMQANESAAIGALKTYASNQSIYQKANYSGANNNQGGGPKRFASSFTNLGGTAAHKNAGGTLLALIPDVFATATVATTPYQGYFFTNDAAVTNFAFDFGLYADPAMYGKSGINSFHIGGQGVILQKDLATAGSGGSQTLDSTWVVP